MEDEDDETPLGATGGQDKDFSPPEVTDMFMVNGNTQDFFKPMGYPYVVTLLAFTPKFHIISHLHFDISFRFWWCVGKDLLQKKRDCCFVLSDVVCGVVKLRSHFVLQERTHLHVAGDPAGSHRLREVQ